MQVCEYLTTGVFMDIVDALPLVEQVRRVIRGATLDWLSRRFLQLPWDEAKFVQLFLLEIGGHSEV